MAADLATGLIVALAPGHACETAVSGIDHIWPLGWVYLVSVLPIFIHNLQWILRHGDRRRVLLQHQQLMPRLLPVRIWIEYLRPLIQRRRHRSLPELIVGGLDLSLVGQVPIHRLLGRCICALYGFVFVDSFDLLQQLQFRRPAPRAVIRLQLHFS